MNRLYKNHLLMESYARVNASVWKPNDKCVGDVIETTSGLRQFWVDHIILMINLCL